MPPAARCIGANRGGLWLLRRDGPGHSGRMMNLLPHLNTARYLRAGQNLFVESGELLLRESPRTVGSSFQGLALRLVAGQSHRVVQAGWVHFEPRLATRLRLG